MIEHWGGPKPLQGRVRLVEPGAFTKVSALGVEEQRVWVVIDLASPYEQWAALGDGFRVDVSVVVQEIEDALLIPIGALTRRDGRMGRFGCRGWPHSRTSHRSRRPRNEYGRCQFGPRARRRSRQLSAQRAQRWGNCENYGKTTNIIGTRREKGF